MKTILTIEQSAELIKRGVSADKASAAVIYLDYAGEEVEPHKIFKRKGDSVLLTRLRNGTVIGVEAKIALKGSDSNYSVPIFTIADLLSLLPKEIDGCNLTIGASKEDWRVAYESDEFDFDRDNFVITRIIMLQFAKELVDALFLALCNCLDNHVKLN